MAGSIQQPAPLTNWVSIPAVLVLWATAMQNSPMSPFSSLAVVVPSPVPTEGWPGPVGLGGWLGSLPNSVPVPVLTGLNVAQLC